jgi:hypothetical protein
MVRHSRGPNLLGNLRHVRRRGRARGASQRQGSVGIDGKGQSWRCFCQNARNPQLEILADKLPKQTLPCLGALRFVARYRAPSNQPQTCRPPRRHRWGSARDRNPPCAGGHILPAIVTHNETEIIPCVNKVSNTAASHRPTSDLASPRQTCPVAPRPCVASPARNSHLPPPQCLDLLDHHVDRRERIVDRVAVPISELGFPARGLTSPSWALDLVGWSIDGSPPSCAAATAAPPPRGCACGPRVKFYDASNSLRASYPEGNSIALCRRSILRQG